MEHNRPQAVILDQFVELLINNPLLIGTSIHLRHNQVVIMVLLMQHSLPDRTLDRIKEIFKRHLEQIGVHICTEHVLKEYAPQNVELLRDETGTLHPLNAKENERFFCGMERFRSGAKIQLSLRREIDARNTTSQLEGIYKGNGTLYLSMPCFSGVAYDEVEETNLYQLLQRIRAITRAVASYHRHGYLHLDIKPENVFALQETAELVLLFDFDSVVRIEEAADGRGILSCTKTWAAPEQLLPGRRNRICQATDLFAIGEILFFKLMGHHSTRAERRSFARFSYDPSNALLSQLNPRGFLLLSEIFHHTICAEVSQRYRLRNIYKTDTSVWKTRLLNANGIL